MRKLKEAARLLLEFKLGVRQIARTCDISTSTAHAYVDRLKELDVPYGEIAVMGDDELEDLLFPQGERAPAKPLPDFEYLSKEMTRPGVTLMLLHEEYKKDNPGGYERSRFYELYSRWSKKVDPVMRFTHKAGEKMFIDFSGDKAHYQDPVTGEIIEAELFVSVLGASSYLYARAVPDQTVEHFVNCVMRAFEAYGGCAEYLVPDNLKSAVTHSSYYEPDINRTFAAMAEHYHVAVLPATGEESTGQSQGRKRCAPSPTPHPRGAQGQDVLQPGGAQRGHRGGDEEAERAAYDGDQQIPA